MPPATLISSSTWSLAAACWTSAAWSWTWRTCSRPVDVVTTRGLRTRTRQRVLNEAIPV
jgi:hypothetical protein